MKDERRDESRSRRHSPVYDAYARDEPPHGRPASPGPPWRSQGSMYPSRDGRGRGNYGAGGGDDYFARRVNFWFMLMYVGSCRVVLSNVWVM